MVDIAEQTEERTELRFKVFTGPMKLASSEDGAPIVSCTASSTITDLMGDRMSERCVESMAKQAHSRMTIFLNHSYDVPEDVFGSVVGARVVRRQSDDGAEYADLDLDIEVDQTNERAQKVLAQIQAGRKLGVSIGCIVTDYEPIQGTKPLRWLINDVRLLEASIVGIPANPRSWVRDAVAAIKTALTRGRRRDEPPVEETKEEWDTAYINDLPDSAFACIEPGGKKDDEGKTTPRSLRHYPHHDKSGNLDLPHLRNALARIADKSNIQCGKNHLLAHARDAGIGDEDEKGFAVLLDPQSDLWQYVEVDAAAAAEPEVGLALDAEGQAVAENDDAEPERPEATTETEPETTSGVEEDVTVLSGAAEAIRGRLDSDAEPLLDLLVSAIEAGAARLKEARSQIETLRRERDELRQMLAEAMTLIATIAKLPLGRKATYTSYVNSFRQRFAGIYPDELLAIIDERTDDGSR